MRFQSFRLVSLMLFVSLVSASAVQSQQEAATSSGTNQAAAFYRQGLSHHKMGRNTEAIEAFKQAIRLRPDYAEAYNNLGYIYDELGRYQEALAVGVISL